MMIKKSRYSGAHTTIKGKKYIRALPVSWYGRTWEFFMAQSDCKDGTGIYSSTVLSFTLDKELLSTIVTFELEYPPLLYCTYNDLLLQEAPPLYRP